MSTLYSSVAALGIGKKIMQIEQNAFKMIKDGMSRDSKKENSKPKPCVFLNFYQRIY